jgi:hypothetical protein
VPSAWCADDECGVDVTLTEEGAELRARGKNLPVELSQAYGLTDQQTATLREPLRTVTDNTSRYAPRARADRAATGPATGPLTGVTGPNRGRGVSPRRWDFWLRYLVSAPATDHTSTGASRAPSPA